MMPGMTWIRATTLDAPSSRVRRIWVSWGGWLALLAGLAIFFVWAVGHLGTFAWDIDEGMYLMRTRMWRAGYDLYTDIWFNQPPGLVLLTRLAFAVFGESVAVGRGIVVGLATLGLLGGALIGRELDGWAGAFTSLIFVATAPLFVRLSRALMSSLPALCLATLSLALVLIYRRRREQRWLILSGLIFGGSLTIKFIGLPILAPIGLALLVPPPNSTSRWRTVVRDSVIWGLGALLPLALLLPMFDSRAMFEQVVGSLFEARNAYSQSTGADLDEMASVLSAGHLSLVMLGMYGLGLTLRRRSITGAVLIAWFLAAVVALVFHTPIWYHHAFLILMPLGIGAGVGVNQLVRFVRSRRQWTWADGVWVTLGVEVTLAFLVFLPRTVREIRGSVTWSQPAAWAAVDSLRVMAEPGDYVITDHPIMAFRAGLYVPPDLCDPGSKRINAGQLTQADLLADIRRYNPPAIVIWNKEFSQYLPEFVDWVEDRYLPARVYNLEQRIYVLDLERAGLLSPEVDFDDHIALLGHRLDRQVVQPGDTIYLTLLWQAQGPVDTRYTVFAHLLDAAWEKWGQKDAVPWDGLRPTTTWEPGKPIADTLAINVSPDAPPGEYRLAVGMYDSDSKERLSVLDEAGQPESTEIFLGPVTLRPERAAR